MVIYENINDRKAVNIELTVNIWSFCFIKSKTPYKLHAPKAGIESKKDIFAASILLNFKNLAPVIIIPDLLTPGIKANV